MKSEGVIWNEPAVPGEHGEDGVLEFVGRCTTHKRAANMVYRNRGPRGAVLKGFVIGCSRDCGLAASNQPIPPRPHWQELLERVIPVEFRT